MKKFLFVALLGALVACNDTTTTTSSEDSARIADSIAKANTPVMSNDTSSTMMSDTSSTMMSDTSSSMMSDTTNK